MSPRPSQQEIGFDILIGFAMAFYGAWVLVSFQSLNIYSTYGNGEEVLDLVYLVSIITVTAALFVIGYFERISGRLFDHRWMFWLLPVIMCISTFFMPFGAIPGFWGDFICICTGIISGISSAGFLMYTGMILSHMEIRDVVIAAVIGVIFGSVVFTVSLLFDSLPVIIYASLLPIVTAILIRFAFALTDSKDYTEVLFSLNSDEKLSPMTNQKPLEKSSDKYNLNHLIVRITICVFLITSVNELCRTLYIQTGIVGEESLFYASLQMIALAVLIIGAFLIAMAMLNVNNAKMPRLCYLVLGCALALNVTLLPLPAIYNVSAGLTYAINLALYNCFAFFIWIILAALCRKFSQTKVRTFAYIRAGWAAGPLVGLLVGRFIFHNYAMTPMLLYPIMIIALAAVLIAMGGVFNEHVLLEGMSIIPLERRQRFRDKIRYLIRKYGLTDREGEVMTLFAMGNNLAYIQEELHLSKSTVSTHRQHIYQKLGIHSHQELLDLLRDTDPYSSMR
ncbi:MAG: LuxR family transcriptional regulator [Eggerthellaceae bacterium]|nr:LuxR family transcriptional regulator [Eggerthellaceae bacterium]